MKAYEGRGVPEGGRIAVIANDAIGNFVVATPLLQMIRAHLKPAHLDYFGGRRTIELQLSSDLFDWSFPLHHTPEEDAFEAVKVRKAHGDYDLVVNIESSPFARKVAAMMSGHDTFVCGPCEGLDYPDDERGRLLADTAWISEDLTKRYPYLQSGFIGEIFCRAAYLDGPIPLYRVPSCEPDIDLPDILISTAASLPEKLWPIQKWKFTLSKLAESGHRVGLLGAKPSAQRDHWKGADEEEELVSDGWVEDLRGAFTMPQVVGALSRVRAVLTIDNGILHLAVAANTPTVGLFRHGIHRLWAPPFKHLTVLTAGEGRQVADLEEERVLEAVHFALA